jgi:aspartokinase
MTEITATPNQTEITVTPNQTIATFAESAAMSQVCEVLEQAAAAGINIDMIARLPSASTQIDLGFTFADEALPDFLKIVSKQKKSVSSGNVKIVVKSQAMISGTGFASKVFAALKELDCSPLLITTGIDEISLLVHESAKSDLAEKLRKLF